MNYMDSVLLQCPLICLFFLLIIFFLSFSCLSKARTKNCFGHDVKEAPQAAGSWPIIGHLHLLGGRDQLLYRTLGSMADKYGSAFNIRLGSHVAFVVSSWEVAKECFTVNDKALANRPTTVAAKHMGYNCAVMGFAPYSRFWRTMRKITTTELLSDRRIKMLKHVRVSELDISISELYRLWDQKNCSAGSDSSSYVPGPVSVELKQWFETLTLNMVVRMVAGKRYSGVGDTCNENEARRCQKASADLIYLIGKFVVSDAIPWLWWLDLQGNERAMKRTAKEFDTILGGWLEEHRKRRAAGGEEEKDEGEKDFIYVMLALEEEGQLSDFKYDADTIIKSTCLAMIVGGGATEAGTLTWAIALLLNNPDILKTAQNELDIHVGKTRQVDESDIKNLVYLQAIVKETLRLYPANPLLVPREATEDCTISGFKVRAGTRLIVNAWKLQRDPRVWTDPSEFIPERFLTSHKDIDVRGKHFQLIPFGSGRRSCPGMSFALQVLHLTLARLIHGFELVSRSGELIDMTESSGLTIPNHVEVLLTPRLSSNLYE